MRRWIMSPPLRSHDHEEYATGAIDAIIVIATLPIDAIGMHELIMRRHAVHEGLYDGLTIWCSTTTGRSTMP
jgi:hypothetical protein